MDPKELSNFTNAVVSAYKAVSSTPSGNFGHGPGGTFSVPGLDRFVFNAMMMPHLGVQGRLPLNVRNDTHPEYSILTGVTASSGSQPSGACDNFKTAGLAKLCTYSPPFGRYGLDTTVVNIEHAGEVTNRGEMVDLQLIGDPTAATVNASGVFPQVPINGSPLQNESAKRLFELAASFADEYSHIFWDGSPLNNVGDGYHEYYGLETLVNTGYRDSITGVACPAADSIVWSFGNNAVTDASANLVGKVQHILFRLRHIASRANLGAVRWVMAMPLGLFYKLTEVWSYYYITQAIAGLTFNSSVSVNVGGADATALRDQMRGDMETRTGQFLFVDGQRIDVWIDDAMPVTEVTPGVFSADIYILPVTVRGGTQPVLYKESFNYATPGGSMEVARMFTPGDSFFTTDAGTFLWHRKPPTNYCVQLSTVTRPRVILRTPYIAARITDVSWTPETEHERSPFTSNSYFVNGGMTSYEGYFPSFYSPTS